MEILKDEDIQIGESETDIRGLSRKSKDQVNLRLDNLKITYLKTIHEDMVDMMRLCMVMLKKMGVENIQKEIEEIMGENK